MGFAHDTCLYIRIRTLSHMTNAYTYVLGQTVFAYDKCLYLRIWTNVFCTQQNVRFYDRRPRQVCFQLLQTLYLLLAAQHVTIQRYQKFFAAMTYRFFTLNMQMWTYSISHVLPPCVSRHFFGYIASLSLSNVSILRWSVLIPAQSFVHTCKDNSSSNSLIIILTSKSLLCAALSEPAVSSVRAALLRSCMAERVWEYEKMSYSIRDQSILIKGTKWPDLIRIVSDWK